MIDFSEVTVLDESYIKTELERVRELIREDAKKGIMQDNASGLQYKDKDYIRKKRKGFYPRQISTNTSYVDMTLTGDLFKNMQVKSVENQGELIVAPEDGFKVSENEKRGRIIIGLREDNVDIITTDVVNQMAKNIEESNFDTEIYVSINL